jgi:ectoine hydroxylase-related dioxygenase (phytanoyl-CoA dioxygenase family)
MRFNGTRLYETDDFEEMPDLEAMRAKLDIAVWDMQPGDAIAFNFRTLHTAPGNRAMTPRRVFSARWVGDDAVFARRSGTTSPPFRELAFEDGAPFDAPIFPVVHRS